MWHTYQAIGLETKVVEYVEGKPVVMATWVGQQPQLPCVVLNSHYDVVPAVEAMWSCDPFGAELKNGDIYARGTQDMKSVCVQYICAVRRLVRAGFVPLRTVRLTFVPDEEIGGADGMKLFIAATYQDLNIGVCLDEGLANPGNAFTIFYAERSIIWLLVRAQGAAGHGSRFVDNTAMVKLHRTIANFLKFRESEKAKLKESNKHNHSHPTSTSTSTSKRLKLGDVTTVNLTALQGGTPMEGKDEYALNVIPTDALAGFDIRIPPYINLDDFTKQYLDPWTAETGVSYSFFRKTSAYGISSTDRTRNPYWRALTDTIGQYDGGVPLEVEIFPAGTDGRYIRDRGTPTYGFSPIRNTPVLLHDHDERISVDVFLDGIQVYERLIPALSEVPDHDPSLSRQTKPMAKL